MYWVRAFTFSVFAFVIPFGVGTFLYQRSGMGSTGAGFGVLLMGAGVMLALLTSLFFIVRSVRGALKARAKPAGRVAKRADANVKPAEPRGKPPGAAPLRARPQPHR